MTHYVLDIETTMDITPFRIRLVGIKNMSTGMHHFLTSNHEVDTFLSCLGGTDTVFTYMGERFDWPRLAKHWNIKRENYKFQHRDIYIITKMVLPDLHSHSLANVGKHFNPGATHLHKLEPWEEMGVDKADYYNYADLRDLKRYCGRDLDVTAEVVQHVS